MCESLGLNPKGRSGVVRMRVLDHVRRRIRPESWRAGRDHMAALLTRLGYPNLSEDLWESTIRLDAPAPWVGLGQAQVAGGFLSEAAKSFDRAAQMGDRTTWPLRSGIRRRLAPAPGRPTGRGRRVESWTPTDPRRDSDSRAG